MFNNTKADGNMFWILILAFLALVVGAIILLFAKPAIEKGFGVTTTQIGSLDDFDDDKIANFFDKCPCTSPGTVEDSSLQGCPRGTTAEQSQENKKLFKDGKCAEIVPVVAEAGITSLKVFDGEKVISSPYSTSNGLLRFEATCATNNCVLEFRPAFRQPIEFDTLGEKDTLSISDSGTYFIILKESNQEKVQFRIQKTE